MELTQNCGIINYTKTLKIFSIKNLGPRREHFDHKFMDCFTVVILDPSQTFYRVSSSSCSNETARRMSSHPRQSAGTGRVQTQSKVLMSEPVYQTHRVNTAVPESILGSKREADIINPHKGNVWKER